MKKPLYQKIQESRAFTTREQAVQFAQEMKVVHKQGEQSMKYDIVRTPNSEWKVLVFVKV